MNDITHVSLFGIEMELNKVAFSLFGLEVRWYGIVITLGIIFAFFYTIWRGKRNEGIKSDDIIDVGIVAVFAGIIGARAYYVITTWGKPGYDYDSLIDIIAIWNGGIAIYGAIIGGALGALGMCLIKKMSWRKVFDMIVPGLMIAQSLGRWGNFFNGEAHGSVIADTTQLDLFGKLIDLPSGEGTIFHFFRMGLDKHNIDNWVYYHPTFLYESLWNLVGFVLLNIFYKRKRFDGQITLMYFTWYGLGRMFIEGLRTDSLYIPGTTLRISQCVGLLCVLVGGTLLTVFLIRNRHGDPFANVVLEEEQTPAWLQRIKDLIGASRADRAVTADAELPSHEETTPEEAEIQETENETPEEEENYGNEN